MVAITACCVEALPSIAAMAVDSPVRSASKALAPKPLRIFSNPSLAESFSAPLGGAGAPWTVCRTLLSPMAEVINFHLSADQLSWKSSRGPVSPPADLTHTTGWLRAYQPFRESGSRWAF
jgi:hypothetical protein